MIQGMINNRSGDSKPKKNPASVSELKKIWIYKVLDDGTIMITNYKGMDIDVRIPEMIGKKKVTEIDYQAFSPYKICPPYRDKQQTEVCINLTTVYISDGIRKIAGNAFAGCKKLTIIGHKESVAEMFAEENKIPFRKKD